MMGAKTGVLPCYENQFQVGSPLTNIADMENFSIKIDNGVEEWNPYETEGWTKRLMTAKSITISVSGKRNYGDTGNDLIAEKFMKNGKEAEEPFQWTFPDGSKLKMENAIINITNIAVGDSTNAGPLEFDVMSNGKPEYTGATE